MGRAIEVPAPAFLNTTTLSNHMNYHDLHFHRRRFNLRDDSGGAGSSVHSVCFYDAWASRISSAKDSTCICMIIPLVLTSGSGQHGPKNQNVELR